MNKTGLRPVSKPVELPLGPPTSKKNRRRCAPLKFSCQIFPANSLSKHAKCPKNAAKFQGRERGGGNKKNLGGGRGVGKSVFQDLCSIGKKRIF